MKHRIIPVLFASALSFTAFSAFTGVAIHNQVNEQPVKVEAGEGSYYSSISDTLTGTELLNALHTLNSQKRTSLVTYQGMRQFAAKCDADPDGSGKIIGFYDNAKIGPSWDSGSTWNREHVWPNVRGGNKVEGDAHMVRPAATSTNSDRGSKGFGFQSYDPGKAVNYYRGAAARIIFYAAIADTSLGLIDDPLNYNGCNSNHTDMMGSLSDMLKWNLQYLPSDTSFTGANDLARRTELNRNEVIQTASGGQGNRNPFIDHPEYACKIWGDTNSKTRAICNGEVPPITPEEPEEAITLNENTKNLAIGDSFELIATTKDNLNVIWTFDNDCYDVLTFDSSITTTESGEKLLLTAKQKGRCEITAVVDDGTYLNSATCVITVGDKQNQTDPDTNNPDQRRNNTTLYVVLGVVGGAILIAGIVVLVIFLVKKKKPI